MQEQSAINSGQIRQEFSQIVADLRAHLELQKALGVRVVETGAAVPLHDRPVVPAESPAGQAGQVSQRGGTAPLSGSSALDAVRAELGDCTRCSLHAGRKNIVFGEGAADARLLFIGEGPGADEDDQGRPFAGEAGDLLTKIIEKGMKIKRSEVYICTIVKCRPPENQHPAPEEISACIGYLKKQIAAIKPRVIVTLGNTATQALLNAKEGVTKLRGAWQVYEAIPVMPTFHPAYLLRVPSAKKQVWEDVQKVMAKLQKTGTREA